MRRLCRVAGAGVFGGVCRCHGREGVAMRSVSSSCGSMNDVGLVGKVYRVSRPLVSQRRMVEGLRSQRVAASLTVMRSRRRLGSVAFMGVPYLAVHARATRALLRIGMHGWACSAWRARRLRVAPSGRRLRGWVRVRWSRPPFWSGVEKRPGPWAVVVPRRPGRFFVSGQSVQMWRTSRFGCIAAGGGWCARAVNGGMGLDPSGIRPEGVAWRCTTG